MLGSKVIVSEKTRVYKDLSPRERGKIRWERLKEADLSTATTRKDIAVLGGYDRDDVKGSSWVNNLVNRGYLAEIIDRKEGQVRYCRYELTGKEPFHRVKRRKTRTKTEQTVQPVQVQERTRYAKITITRGDTTVAIEIDNKGAVELLNNILK